MGDLIELIRQDSKPSQIRRADVRACLLSIHAEGLSKSTISSARNAISGAPEFALMIPTLKKQKSRNHMRLRLILNLGGDAGNRPKLLFIMISMGVFLMVGSK